MAAQQREDSCVKPRYFILCLGCAMVIYVLLYLLTQSRHWEKIHDQQFWSWGQEENQTGIIRNLISPNNARSNDQNSDKDVQKFKASMNFRELMRMLSVVDAFNAALKQANVTFFLCSGSLMGSWRHHGHIPWDDDVDFFLPDALRPVVEQTLSKLAPQFTLSTTQGIRWKVYAKGSKSIRGGIDWRWPFLDLIFYKENSTHIWDSDHRYHEYLYNKKDVFPLTQRPFNGRLLPAPRNSFAVLNRTYNMDMCHTAWYNHRREVSVRRVTKVKCERLKHLFPFVVRTTSPGNAGGCIETLVKNSTIISCCFLDHNSEDCSRDLV
ncbi:uncharacterized protein LOC143285694 [Babylonia areolata]|uniref:uncharacterized protein LOC143285694 n=1 Tax=Babylonia areolata TaxID=304850 RepID=UPI003FD0D754